MEERILWSGRPSQYANARFYTLCGIVGIVFTAVMVVGVRQLNNFSAYKGFYFLCSVAMFLIPFAAALWRWYRTESHTYELTSQRFAERWGVLSKTTHQLELFRVNDISVVEPFLQHKKGLGTIVMQTSDASTPIAYIRAVPDSHRLQNLIRQYVGMMRKQYGIRDMQG